jgi:hypothetical protein
MRADIRSMGSERKEERFEESTQEKAPKSAKEIESPRGL